MNIYDGQEWRTARVLEIGTHDGFGRRILSENPRTENKVFTMTIKEFLNEYKRFVKGWYCS